MTDVATAANEEESPVEPGSNAAAETSAAVAFTSPPSFAYVEIEFANASAEEAFFKMF
ncbi:hypothetical protein [Neisseria chenwenguii]|uniref:hypothetical protein n=1 Tax=Neisseria chenwenguii TaxID=1853278 RepID=UPI0018DF72CE|nr:hypothetical protein [Neisseria chenwenguii]